MTHSLCFGRQSDTVGCVISRSPSIGQMMISFVWNAARFRRDNTIHETNLVSLTFVCVCVGYDDDDDDDLLSPLEFWIGSNFLSFFHKEIISSPSHIFLFRLTMIMWSPMLQFFVCVCVRFVSVMAARLLECACVRVLICLIVPVFIFTLQPGLMSCCSAQFCSDWRLLQYFILLCFLHKEWYKSVGLLMIYRLAFKLMAKSMIKYKYAGGAFLLVSNIYTVYSFCYATASVWRKGSCL